MGEEYVYHAACCSVPLDIASATGSHTSCDRLRGKLVSIHLGFGRRQHLLRGLARPELHREGVDMVVQPPARRPADQVEQQPG